MNRYMWDERGKLTKATTCSKVSRDTLGYKQHLRCRFEERTYVHVGQFNKKELFMFKFIAHVYKYLGITDVKV